MKKSLFNKNYNIERLTVNFLAFLIILVVVWLVVVNKNKNSNTIDLNELTKENISDEDVEKLKEFEKTFGEPLFVSYLVYLKEDEYLDGNYSPEILDKYLIKENDNTLLILKGIFKDLEQFYIAKNTNMLSNTINNSSLIYGLDYVFDIESFTTFQVEKIAVENERYTVVLKSASNVYYEYKNLLSISNISIGDVILPKKKIGKGVGKVLFSMYTEVEGNKIYINPYNFLKLTKR